FVRSCYSAVIRDKETRQALERGIKPPLPTFWMELDSATADPEWGVGAWFFNENRLMCLASVDTGKRLIVVPLGLASVGGLVGDEFFFEDQKTQIGLGMIEDGLLEEGNLYGFLAMGLELMGLLGNSRHASTRRVLPYGDDAIGRRWRRRRFQQG